MNRILNSLVISALVATTSALAQSPLVRPDTTEAKRVGALAAVQGLKLPARSQFSPRIATSAPGERGCTFNIGDVTSMEAGAANGPPPKPADRKGLGHLDYVTVVDASPICVVR